MHHFFLHLVGHARGEALKINGVPIFKLGLQEKLMTFLIRETDDLGFDGRAVSRPNALNRSV